VHKRAWFLIAFVTGIFMRRWALSEGRGSISLHQLRGSRGDFFIASRAVKKRAHKLFERREAASFCASRRTAFNVASFFRCRSAVQNGPFCFLFRPNGKGRARAA